MNAVGTTDDRFPNRTKRWQGQEGGDGARVTEEEGKGEKNDESKNKVKMDFRDELERT